MNSGLPSLIDAIFGKKDLDSVSLDEMYEVISEFPSFNAAHFLLSRKLAMEGNADYEKVSMRTALYFNNPLWLESNLKGIQTSRPVLQVEKVSENQAAFKPEIYSDPVANEPAAEDFQVLEEPVIESLKTESVEEFVDVRPDTSAAVTSFDELMQKYHLEVPEPQEEQIPEFLEKDPPDTSQENSTPEVVQELSTSEPVEKIGIIHDFNGGTREVPVEISQEILNEYGIFEEVAIKGRDYDLEAFDRPIDLNATTDEKPFADPPPVEIAAVPAEIIPEQPLVSKTFERSDEADYEAFDGPVEEAAETEPLTKETSESSEMTAFLGQAEADDTGSGDLQSQESVMTGELQEVVSRFGEKQKSMPLFDSKKAESIVFAPYHMIDYFASQGIKLVLDDQPSDSFGKQLKSFTDWLKVMKKVPLQPASDKLPEKEADRIRNFAAHSIEERDIMTESMAEVLAKQGMYENAIALFQKLSLIYPPKSAYFASRIEQLKASLP